MAEETAMMINGIVPGVAHAITRVGLILYAVTLSAEAKDGCSSDRTIEPT
jgi:hypothetical protein